MTDAQLAHLEKRLEEAEDKFKSRLADFEKSLSEMSKAMQDVRDALMGEITDLESLGLIAGHRQLKSDVTALRAELAKWRGDSVDPVLEDVKKFKVQGRLIVVLVTAGASALWSLLLHAIWK